MAKQTIKLTESKLRTIVEDCVRETLGETLMGNVRSKIKDGINDIGNKINDFAQGYETKEGNPQSIEEVFEGDGYKVLKSFNKNGATYYAVVRKTGAFAEFFGPEGNDMAEELNIYLDGNGTATYVGYHPKVKGTELFKIEF